MSEELEKGIPKAIPTGERRTFTKEEREEHDRILETFMKKIGALKENESIKDCKHLIGEDDL